MTVILLLNDEVRDCQSSRKWLTDLTHMNSSSPGIKEMNYYLLTPRRNSNNFCPSGLENTRMTVPWGGGGVTHWLTGTALGGRCDSVMCPTFSEAVASLVPLASNASAAKGLSWAGIMLAALWRETHTHTHTHTHERLHTHKRLHTKTWNHTSFHQSVSAAIQSEWENVSLCVYTCMWVCGNLPDSQCQTLGPLLL